jgi:cytochrome c-type biogenesis protein CcsB
MNLWLLRLALALYVLATAGQMLHLFTLGPKARRVARQLTWLAFSVHTLAILFRFFEAGYTPVTSLHEAYSFFGWCIVGLHLAFQLRYDIPTMGAFTTPVALIMLFGAVLSPGEIGQLPPALQSWWLPVHVVLIFIGDGAFALAAVVGVMYILQERQLKTKKMGALFHRLPNIDVLDAMNYRCLTIGFPLLTLGIITGAAWAQTAWGTYWQWDPKETWSLITWFLYAGLLHGRLTVGWRGRKAAIWSIIGFCSVLFTFLGVNYVLPMIIPDLESLHIYTGS